MDKIIGIIRMTAAQGVIDKAEADAAIARLTADIHEGYISKQDAVKRFGVAARTLDEAAQKGRLHRFHKGAAAYYLISEVDAIYGIKPGRTCKGRHPADQHNTVMQKAI